MNEGCVILDKNPGRTSFQSLSFLKKQLGTKKVGHCGTLDKFASGVLVIMVGKMTKLSSYVMGKSKTYRAGIVMGQTTATLDPESPLSDNGRIPRLSEIERVLPLFRGELQQVPPQYSAVHVEGVRAYQRVLNGEEPVLAPRTIQIYTLELRDYDENTGLLNLDIGCSKGTYIRSLARDLAEKLGTVAHVQTLQRRSVGSFTLEKAVSESAFSSENHLLGARTTLEMLDIPCYGIDSNYRKVVQTGKWIPKEALSSCPIGPGLLGIFDSKLEEFWALCRWDGNSSDLTYEFVALGV